MHAHGQGSRLRPWAEALTGATLNAACSLGLGGELGSVEVGNRGGIVLADTDFCVPFKDDIIGSNAT